MSFDPRSVMQFRTDGKPLSATPPKRVARTHAQIAELDRVTIGQEAESDDGDVVPAGSTGTVVGIWAAGAAYEVEFVQPFSALATVRADAIAVHFPRS